MAAPEAQDVHAQFSFDADAGEKANDYKCVLKKFNEYCKPRKNTRKKRTQRTK